MLAPSKMKLKRVNDALQMLQRGDPFDHVRRVTSITLAELVRMRVMTEIKVPDPKGYTYDEKGKMSGHNGKVLSTGRFQCQWPTATVPMKKVGNEMVRLVPSNKELKKSNRKKFFIERRERWRRLQKRLADQPT